MINSKLYEISTSTQLKNLQTTPQAVFTLTLLNFINKRSLNYPDIIIFVEFLINNPIEIQIIISQISSHNLFKLKKYLQILRIFSPSCFLLFYNTKQLNWLAKNFSLLLFWMVMNKNPLPFYDSDFSFKNSWLVWDDKSNCFRVHRVLLYTIITATKLARFSKKQIKLLLFKDVYFDLVYCGPIIFSNKFIPFVNNLNWNSLQNFCRLLNKKFNKNNIWFQIRDLFKCKTDIHIYITIKMIDEIFQSFNKYHNFSILNVKKIIKTENSKYQQIKFK